MDVMIFCEGTLMVYLEYQDYFIGWGTLALINAAIAQVSGRPPLLWLLLSLFLGPIATILLLITYKYPFDNHKKI